MRSIELTLFDYDPTIEILMPGRDHARMGTIDLNLPNPKGSGI